MAHCGKYVERPVSRRDMLTRCANGFGGVAMTGLLAQYAKAAPLRPSTELANGRLSSHHRATAKNVIFLYMDGGPSQVDTFDYKPFLEKYHGRDPREVIGKLAPTQFDNVGKVLQPQWKFKQHGQAGHWISSLFPHLSEVADDLAVVKSMTSKFSEHTSANYFLHTGNGLQGRPSMGAWLGYGGGLHLLA